MYTLLWWLAWCGKVLVWYGEVVGKRLSVHVVHFGVEYGEALDRAVCG